MKIVIDNRHNDYSGGGRLILQIARCLKHYGEVYFKNEQHNDTSMSGIDMLIKKYDGSFIPDLFIVSSHSGYHEEKIGRKNGYLIYFPYPGNESPKDFDFIICMNEFVKKYAQEKYERPIHIITPSVELEQYSIAEKENIILNLGNYFYEPDGNSKNQHFVLDWFIKNKLYEEYELIFSGFIINQTYFQHLIIQATPFKGIHLLHGIPRKDVLRLYSKAKYLVHAMGYGRTSAYQTEHFGYIAIEAMASGCQPIVYNSGGCRDIEGVLVWNNFDQIIMLLTDTNPLLLRSMAKKYSFDNMRKQTEELIKSL